MAILSNIDKGRLGEKYTVKFLKKHKYKIIECNMRNRYSEIDIIAENKEYIIFVEVKTRSSGQVIPPSAAVNKAKQLKIMKAARYYLSYASCSQKQPRFDVAEVFLNEKNRPERINYISGAFMQGGGYAAF